MEKKLNDQYTDMCLDSLSIDQLKSLLPAYRPDVNTYIEHLIAKKEAAGMNSKIVIMNNFLNNSIQQLPKWLQDAMKSIHYEDRKIIIELKDENFKID